MAMTISDFSAKLKTLQDQATNNQDVKAKDITELENNIDEMSLSDPQKKQFHLQLEGLENIATLAENPATKGTSATNSEWKNLMSSAQSLADDLMSSDPARNGNTPRIMDAKSVNGDFGVTQDGKVTLYDKNNKPITVEPMGPNETRKLADGLYANTDNTGELTFGGTAAHEGTAMNGSIDVGSDAFKDKGTMTFDEKADMYFSAQKDGGTKVYDLHGAQIAEVKKGEAANIKLTNPADPANPFLQVTDDGQHKFSPTPDIKAGVQGTLTGKGGGGYAPADLSVAAKIAATTLPSSAPAPTIATNGGKDGLATSQAYAALNHDSQLYKDASAKVSNTQDLSQLTQAPDGTFAAKIDGKWNLYAADGSLMSNNKNLGGLGSSTSAKYGDGQPGLFANVDGGGALSWGSTATNTAVINGRKIDTSSDMSKTSGQGYSGWTFDPSTDLTSAKDKYGNVDFFDMNGHRIVRVGANTDATIQFDGDNNKRYQVNKDGTVNIKGDMNVSSPVSATLKGTGGGNYNSLPDLGVIADLSSVEE